MNIPINQETPERIAFVKIITTIESCNNFNEINSCRNMLATYDKRFPENIGLTSLESIFVSKFANILRNNVLNDRKENERR